jgi:predicted ABC-type ATPase
MPAPRPILHLIGGCNGAGKTTFARAYIADLDPPVRFLNADEVARGLSPFAPESVARKAARLLLLELEGCLQAGASLALESTLSGHGHIRLLERARVAGYRIHLNYLWLRSADLAVSRVAQRVAKGGHDVPEADVRRRYLRSQELLVTAYLPLADKWWIWENKHGPSTLLAKSRTESIGEAAQLLRPE